MKFQPKTRLQVEFAINATIFLINRNISSHRFMRRREQFDGSWSARSTSALSLMNRKCSRIFVPNGISRCFPPDERRNCSRRVFHFSLILNSTENTSRSSCGVKKKSKKSFTENFPSIFLSLKFAIRFRATQFSGILWRKRRLARRSYRIKYLRTICEAWLKVHLGN